MIGPFHEKYKIPEFFLIRQDNFVHLEIFAHLNVFHLGFVVVLINVDMGKENLAAAVPGDSHFLEKFHVWLVFNVLVFFFKLVQHKLVSRKDLITGIASDGKHVF